MKNTISKFLNSPLSLEGHSQNASRIYLLISVIFIFITPILLYIELVSTSFYERYYEIFVKCSIKELVKRDTKNLYKLAKKKMINNLIGYNSKIIYEKSRYKKILIVARLYY